MPETVGETRYEEAAWKGYGMWAVILPDGTGYHEVVEPDGSVHPLGPPLPWGLMQAGSVDFLRGWASHAAIESGGGS